MDKFNYTMLCDFYELTMGNGYFVSGMQEKISYFDLFFRQIPDGGGFAIACGLEQVINYIENLHFDEEDIEFLRSKGIFDECFLKYLKDFRFTGDIFAVPEGTVVFPNEPIITVRAPAVQAQLVETYLLLCINHQTLIATKANRIVRAAQGRAVSEFGSRRAHGADAAILGARAAGIGGCSGTAFTITDQLFGFNATGTMAHSWVQMFDSELEAFKTYCKCYPNGTVLLVDTYNVLKSGVPNAIKAFDEVLKPMGCRPVGIRIDSGDITYLSKKARKMLDDAGLTDCKIVVSNSLDEWTIMSILEQGGCIDSFGVGERLITAKSAPVFGAVYKIAAVEENVVFQPRIKISENVEKITNPGLKKVYRIYDENKKAIADLIAGADEVVDLSQPYRYVDPVKPWKNRYFENCTAVELQQLVVKNGKRVMDRVSIDEIKKYVQDQLTDNIWEEEQRFENPHNHYLDMSPAYYDMKMSLLQK